LVAQGSGSVGLQRGKPSFACEGGGPPRAAGWDDRVRYCGHAADRSLNRIENDGGHVSGCIGRDRDAEIRGPVDELLLGGAAGELNRQAVVSLERIPGIAYRAVEDSTTGGRR
jgi:hypothetical protein